MSQESNQPIKLYAFLYNAYAILIQIGGAVNVKTYWGLSFNTDKEAARQFVLEQFVTIHNLIPDNVDITKVDSMNSGIKVEGKYLVGYFEETPK